MSFMVFLASYVDLLISLTFQLRLDFNTFNIAGPSTTTASSFQTLNGQQTTGTNANARASSVNSQCLVDTFQVTNPGGITPPLICGNNAGEHSKCSSKYFLRSI